MNKKTTGAWIIHHCEKLRSVNLPTLDYERIDFAGRCGTMLNALATSEQVDIEQNRIHALAKANGISTRLELPSILEELERQRLIDRGTSGISVLGLTTAQVLEQTTSILEDADPSDCEKAAIEVAERISELPIVKKKAIEYVADTFGLTKKDTDDFLSQCEQIGFVDSEEISGQRLYFNGNLFRRDNIAKVNAVIASLGASDERHVMDLSAKLASAGCIPKKEATRLLGDSLYSKLCSIGFLDENTIGNEAGTYKFVTRPASFCKFSNSAADDAFDLAKAFVTSLTYGMISSPYGRGRITMISALMRKLIAGHWVGPATAIGQDYKVLEIRGVIQVRPAGDGRFYMRLLKKDVGRLALMVITEGEASTQSLLQLPSVSATNYDGPEKNRIAARKRQTQPLRKGVAKLLNDLRTGELR